MIGDSDEQAEQILRHEMKKSLEAALPGLRERVWEATSYVQRAVTVAVDQTKSILR